MIDQYNSLAEKFLKKGFWLYLFSFIIAPIWYIIKIIISWELTVSEVGILYWIISLITLLWAYNDLWMTESLSYFIPKFVAEKRYDKVKSILFYAFFTQIFTSIIIASFFFFWADYISEHYFKTDAAKETIKVFAFFFIWINILQIISSFFNAIQDTFSFKIVDFVRMVSIMLSVLYIFLWDTSSLLNYSYTWIIWLYIWILVSLLIFYRKYYKKYFEKEKILIDKKLIKQVFKYAIYVFLWASAWSILWQIDMQMIIYMLWTTEAWYYTNYLSIIWIPFMIIWPVFWMLFPIFAEMHSKWETEKIRLVKAIFQKNFLNIWIAFNLFMFIFAEIIAFTLFWEKFITSWTILKYSILLLIFNFFLQINFNIMAGIWKVKERVKIVSIAIIVNFIMNLIFINIIWVYWAALATSFWWVLIWLLSEISLWKKYRVKFEYKSIVKNVLFMWFLWFVTYNYILNILNSLLSDNLTRIDSFIYLFILFILWMSFFVIINYKEFRAFTWEIKKLKKW